MSTTLEVSGQGTSGQTATLIASLTADADGSPIPGGVVNFALDIGGGPVSVGSRTTGSDGTVELDGVSLAGVSEGAYPTAVVGDFPGDGVNDPTTGSGELTVFAAPPLPETPEPPSAPEPEPEPESIPQSFSGSDGGSDSPAESFEEQSSAPGIPASTAPFDGGQVPDSFTVDSSGDPFGQGACVNSYTGDECLNSFTGESNIEPYGQGACISPYTASQNEDAYTPDPISSAANYSPRYVDPSAPELNYTPADGGTPSFGLNYSPLEPAENQSLAPSYAPEKDVGFSPLGTAQGDSGLNYSPLEPVENQSLAQSYTPEKDAGYSPLNGILSRSDLNYSPLEPIENQSIQELPAATDVNVQPNQDEGSPYRNTADPKVPPEAASDPWYRFTYPGFYYEAGKYDALQPIGRYETGSIPLNIAANLWNTVGNLLTIPVNAITEAAAIPDEFIRAVGGSEGDVDAWHAWSMTVGVGEISAAREIAQGATELRTLATAAQADLVNAKLAELGPVAAEELGQVKLATNLRGPLEFGHNATGAQVGDTIQFFHQVGDVELPDNDLLRAARIVQGGFPTAVNVRTEAGFAQRGYDILGLQVPAANAQRTLALGQVLSELSTTGYYGPLSNSCTTTSIELLQAAGLNPPFWARTPSMLQWWFKMQGGQ